jgi:hypothetical protein
MQTKAIKNKIKEKIVLDKTNQNIIAALNAKIEKLETELSEIKNIEKQHAYMNGLMHKEIDKYKEEIFTLKKENSIFKENLQAELLRKSK